MAIQKSARKKEAVKASSIKKVKNPQVKKSSAPAKGTIQKIVASKKSAILKKKPLSAKKTIQAPKQTKKIGPIKKSQTLIQKKVPPAKMGTFPPKKHSVGQKTASLKKRRPLAKTKESVVEKKAPAKKKHTSAHLHKTLISSTSKRAHISHGSDTAKKTLTHTKGEKFLGKKPVLAEKTDQEKSSAVKVPSKHPEFLRKEEKESVLIPDFEKRLLTAEAYQRGLPGYVSEKVSKKK